MFGKAKVLFCLAVLSLLLVDGQSQPSANNKRAASAAPNRPKGSFIFEFFGGSGGWTQFRKALKMPTMPTFNFPSISDVFDDSEAHDSLNERIANLENQQNRIIEYLRKVDKNFRPCNKEEQESSTTTVVQFTKTTSTPQTTEQPQIVASSSLKPEQTQTTERSQAESTTQEQTTASTTTTTTTTTTQEPETTRQSSVEPETTRQSSVSTSNAEEKDVKISTEASVVSATSPRESETDSEATTEYDDEIANSLFV